MPAKKRIRPANAPVRMKRKNNITLTQIEREMKKRRCTIEEAVDHLIGSNLDDFMDTSREDTIKEVIQDLFQRQQERINKREDKKWREKNRPPATIESFFVEEKKDKQRAA